MRIFIYLIHSLYIPFFPIYVFSLPTFHHVPFPAFFLPLYLKFYCSKSVFIYFYPASSLLFVFLLISLLFSFLLFFHTLLFPSPSALVYLLLLPSASICIFSFHFPISYSTFPFFFNFYLYFFLCFLLSVFASPRSALPRHIT